MRFNKPKRPLNCLSCLTRVLPRPASHLAQDIFIPVPMLHVCHAYAPMLQLYHEQTQWFHTTHDDPALPGPARPGPARHRTARHGMARHSTLRCIMAHRTDIARKQSSQHVACRRLRRRLPAAEASAPRAAPLAKTWFTLFDNHSLVCYMLAWIPTKRSYWFQPNRQRQICRTPTCISYPRSQSMDQWHGYVH